MVERSENESIRQSDRPECGIITIHWFPSDSHTHRPRREWIEMYKRIKDDGSERHQCEVPRWLRFITGYQKEPHYPGQGSREAHAARMRVLRALWHLNGMVTGGSRRRGGGIAGDDNQSEEMIDGSGLERDDWQMVEEARWKLNRSFINQEAEMCFIQDHYTHKHTAVSLWVSTPC